MKIKHLLVSLALLSATSAVYGQQPYSACWFPDDVINWSPDTDPDAKFNRSRIPLQKRIDTNEGQGQVETATITNKMCSLTPSQGDNNFLGYQPTYWQYMDKFVNWGGAGNEGIFVLPPAGTIDAAHLNGVKILGQLFFMPRTIGGRDEWIEAMLTQVDGKYPYAVKMYEIAKYFGFDGWFINKELDNGMRVSEWAAFIKCFGETADAAGDTYMEIQWYDAKGRPTIEILKSHRNTSQFLEYNSTGDKSSYAEELGCSVNDIMHRIYAGIECVQSGLTGYASALHSAGSVALFCPEQNTYKVRTDPMWEQGKTTGEEAYAAQEDAFAKENLTWAGGTGWTGVKGKVKEMSAITSMPFTTSFSVGLGKHRFAKGEKLNTQDWYSTSVQSILPTWRYSVSDMGDMKVTIDYDDAFNFGNSICLSGAATAGNHIWKLYKTKIAVENGGKLRLTYKVSGTAPEVMVSTSGYDNADITLSGASTSTVNGWTVAEYDLATLNGKTIEMIAVNARSAAANSSYSLKLGELTVVPANYTAPKLAVSDFACTSNFSQTDGDVRLTWSYDYNGDFDHFDIYLTNANGRRLVGQTRGEGFYIPRFQRSANEADVTVELVPVMKDGSYGTSCNSKLAFENAAAPKITVTPVKSYARVGEHIALTVSGTDNPTSFAWTLPESVKLISGELTDASIVVETTAVGSPEITVKASNAVGTSTFKGVAFDVFDNDTYKQVHNAALEKTVSCSRAVTGDAKKLIDGIKAPNANNECWSDISTNPWVVVDLRTPHTLYGFNIYDSHSAFKGGEDNIDNYSVLVSEDGSSWKEVASATGAKDVNVKEINIVPTVARFVKLAPYADRRFTTRVFEFEIIGRDNSQLSLSVPHSVEMAPKESKPVTVNYDLVGDTRADNFGIELKSASSFITIGEPADDGNGNITFDVKAANRIGKATIDIVLRNGDVKRTNSIDIIIDSPEAKNIAKGMTAEMRKYSADYTSETEFSAQNTGNLTDGNTTAQGLTEEMYEDGCHYTDDLWAVFKNPELFSAGKVKIYIPDANHGPSENVDDGIVNKSVSVRVSNDGKNWTTIEKFNNIGETSVLTCMMPDMAPTTYIAVVCDVNYLFYPSLAEVEIYGQLEDAGPRVMPLEIAKGYTHDIIAENTPISDFAKKEFDYGCFFTSNVRAENAIASPDTRLIVSAQGNKFKLGEYDKANVMLMNENKTDFKLDFATPVYTDELHILTARRSGYQDITLTITYEDGTNEERIIAEDDVPKTIYSADNINDFAFTGLKVLEDDAKTGRNTYGLYDLVVKADEGKAVESLNFYAAKGSHEFYVFAVSALTDPNASKIILKPESSNMAIAPGESGQIIVNYNLNGEERADNFALTAEASNAFVTLGTVSEDKSQSAFTVPVTAGEEAGSTDITFILTNGENMKSCKVKVSVSVPAQFNGWNKDIIVESLPAADHATAEVDGEELAFFTSGVQESGALAGDDRIITSAAGTRFILAPYDENNGLVLDFDETLSLNAVTPTNCTQVRILAISNRAADITVTGTYDDATTSESKQFSIEKYNYVENPAAAVNLINTAGYNSWSYDPDETTSDKYNLVELALPLDETKKLSSISFEQGNSRATTTIVAVAKKEKMSGISDAEVSPADRAIEAIYNLQGIRVQNPVAGIYIIRYTDGTSRKVIIK